MQPAIAPAGLNIASSAGLLRRRGRALVNFAKKNQAIDLKGINFNIEQCSKAPWRRHADAETFCYSPADIRGYSARDIGDQ
ncbi:hypothetical protein [Pseudomonas linyingensis]|uniref:hypothetical protein n=1 Tax=Pseudomonas linyingensis TaxID=915471 RepID=UPI0011137CD6|nr:hypothetical protein [Pseudomonas linyingensis]